MRIVAWQLGPTLYANVTAWAGHGATLVEVPPHGRRDDDDQSW